MENITVEVSVPAINRSYDFQLPTNNYVWEIISELTHILETTQQNVLFDRRSPLLCDVDRGLILNPNAMIADVQIKDGTTLILV